MNETSNISVVICSYTEERWDQLVGAVESMRRQSLPPREIILVIDHNARLLENARATFADSLVVENSEPKGLSGARNSGITASHGELIAFLDDDAVAEPDFLLWLSRACENPQVLGAGGKVEPVWPERRPSWFPEEFLWVVGCSYRGLPENPAPVRNPLGGCMCVRREGFDAVGGFQTGVGRVGRVPLGCEETEWAIRARQHWPERPFLYEPRARIWHHVPASRARWRYFLARCYAEGRSKALVSRLVGAKDGLASERTHVLRTLPAGVIRHIRDALAHRDLPGLARAGAIVAGLTVTTAGYVLESLRLFGTDRKGLSRATTPTGHISQAFPEQR